MNKRLSPHPRTLGPLARTALLALLLATITACERHPQAPTETPKATPTYLPKAQERLRTLALRIGEHSITAEIARTATEHATGLMYRDKMGEEEGMLFVMETAGPTAFYMRNTKIPLTIAYIDPKGVIQELHDMKPLDETPVPSASDEVQYVLEMNLGWFQRHNITPGTQIRAGIRTLNEFFFP